MEQSTDEKGNYELNDDGKALVAHLQKLGTNLAVWRETVASTHITPGGTT
jgi:hypothetical protein